MNDPVINDPAMEWVIIFGMAVVTFAVRYPVLLLVSKIPLPAPVFRALQYVPPAVLAAIIVPAVLLPTGTLDLSLGNAALIAALAAVIAARWSKNLLLTIIVGMLAYWGWRILV